MENEIKELIDKYDVKTTEEPAGYFQRIEILEDLHSLLKLYQSQQVSLLVAFVQGAKWWEYQSTGATMWQSDAILAEEEASRKFKNGKLGKTYKEITEERFNENAKNKTERE